MKYKVGDIVIYKGRIRHLYNKEGKIISIKKESTFPYIVEISELIVRAKEISLGEIFNS